MVIMRLKGVKRVVSRKNGRIVEYYYHRKTNCRIKAKWGSDEFGAEVLALEQKVNATKPRDGTLGALIVAYKSSPEFERLARRTQADYNRVFDYLAPIRAIAVSDIDAGMIYGSRDKALRKHGRRFANYVVQVFRLLLGWGKRRDHVEINAGEGVDLLKRPKTMKIANRAWKDEEREAVLAEAPLEQLKVIALGMFAGLREGDAVRLEKSEFDGKVITTIISKTGEPHWIPAHYRLREILSREPQPPKRTRESRERATTLAVNKWGRAWTESGFRASFFKLLRRLELEGKVGPDLTFHGLRHTVGKLVIEAGGSVEDVAAILGHKSQVMAKHYSKEADTKRRMAGVVQRMERTERRRIGKLADKSGKSGKA